MQDSFSEKGLTLPPLSLVNTSYASRQQTLRSEIHCSGIGVHTGRRVRLTIGPADVDHGVTFRRTDLNREIPASFSSVVATNLCTTICEPENPAVQVSTVEHLLAALSGAGVDNAIVTLDGPEVPIFDGSSAPFLFLLDSVGLNDQDARRKVIQIRRPVRVTDGNAWAELRPRSDSAISGATSFDMHVSICFGEEAIGKQSASLTLSPAAFRDQLAMARTFTIASEVSRLQAVGLARGGSLQNAIVVAGKEVLNPGGLRMANEFVYHKMLDVVGDLALAGTRFHGIYAAHRPSHKLNNRLLRAFFAGSGYGEGVDIERSVAAA